MRAIFLLPALAALTLLGGCDPDRRPPAADEASADSGPPSLPHMIRESDSIAREMKRSYDSILEEQGIMVRQEGGLTIVTGSGLRVTYDDDGNMVIDSVSAEAPDGQDTRGLQPDPGTGGIDEFVPAEEAVWGQVARFSGTGSDSTADFRVRSREFRVITMGRTQAPVAWSVGVYDTAGQLRGHVTLEEPGADTNYVHTGPGVFHLMTSPSARAWEVRVEEKLLPAERTSGRNR